MIGILLLFVIDTVSETWEVPLVVYGGIFLGYSAAYVMNTVDYVKAIIKVYKFQQVLKAVKSDIRAERRSTR